MSIRYMIMTLPLLYTRVLADFTPTTPGPGETYNAGSNCTITWDVDNSGTWTNITIDLKSGSNSNMSLVTNVASGLDGTDPSLTPFTWTCPEVDPYSAIYFYQIASLTDDSVTPEYPQQPNGDNIPWGEGQLASSGDGSADVESAEDVNDSANAADIQNLSKAKNKEDSDDDSADNEDHKTSGGEDDSNSGDDSGSSEDQADDGDQENAPPPNRHGRNKDSPTASGSSEAPSASAQAKAGSKTKAEATSDNENTEDTETTSTSIASTKRSNPTKTSTNLRTATTGSLVDPSADAAAESVTDSGSSTALAPTPTPGLPRSQKKVHASTAFTSSAAGQPTTSSDCQCSDQVQRTGAAKLMSGGRGRERSSAWAQLSSLSIIFLLLL
ncbi:hypothetical protein PHLCEN_2v3912 [Hermanssonia centrifuga]|uniref:Yeast cell wall synthesis Kre9/Knh1-like N-terminal domain-containing protein n=1 Tax=Hermanssonia centrifuga TaxID=98765 RepID=A0A2R6QBA6_9APHY|nr:hypothetical protein PHLCEN_2v3912 [Hermanssonia centrifuga]